MKIVQINATCGIGSTGKICVGISEMLSEKNIENYILYSSRGNGCEVGIQCSDDKYIRLQAVKSRLLGNYGFNSKKATEKMILELERIQPDIVHLHNIHGHDCNLELLFDYLKKSGTKIVWTFHDCWAFTGYCPHFDMIGCKKWEDGCGNCPQKKEYSWFFDRSDKLYKKKKSLFENLDLTAVTPSEWLAELVKRSFLKECKISVINNGIDLSVFKPAESEFISQYGLENKKVVLGVSFGWSNKKGLDVFMELSERLPKDYRIVLVGTNDETDRILPKNVISIHRTQSQKELAEIYSAADVFVNPTREENYPTVNMEAIACGTPVVTFKTGGSPEILDETCGSVVEKNDIDALEKEILRICEEKPFLRENITENRKRFDKDICVQKYLTLYKNLICNQGT